MADKLKKTLPDGSGLVADAWDDPDYPGIRISLVKPDGSEEVICFAEYSAYKPDGRNLCVGAYACDLDEPVYYESYNDPALPSPNV